MGQIWGKAYYIMLQSHLGKPFIFRAFRNIVTLINSSKVPFSAFNLLHKPLEIQMFPMVFLF